MSNSKPTNDPPTQRSWARGRVIIPSIVAFVAIGGILLLVAPRWILASWFPYGTDDEIVSRSLGSAAQIVLFSLGGVIALVGVGVSLSRHGQETDAADRARAHTELEQRIHLFNSSKEDQRRQEWERQGSLEIERELRARFVIAVDLLSDHAAPIKRSAGLHALAALADDWQARGRLDERQVCIDVLCEYLKLPLSAASDPSAEISARLTGFALIREHLHPSGVDRVPRWAGATISLTGLIIDFDASLAGSRLTSGAILDLRDTKVLKGGRLRLDDLEIDSDSCVALDRIDISDGSHVNFAGSRISGGSRLAIEGSTISNDSHLTIDGIVVDDHSHLILRGASVDGHSSLSANRAHIKASSTIDISNSFFGRRGRLSAEDIEASDNSHLLLQETSLREAGRILLARMVLTSSSTALLSDITADASQIIAKDLKVDGHSTIAIRGIDLTNVSSLALDNLVMRGSSTVDGDKAAVREHSELSLSGAKVEGGSRINLDELHLDDGSSVTFNLTEVAESSRLSIERASVTDSYIPCTSLVVTDHSNVSFSGARFMNKSALKFKFMSIDEASALSLDGAEVDESSVLSLPDGPGRSRVSMVNSRIAPTSVPDDAHAARGSSHDPSASR